MMKQGVNTMNDLFDPVEYEEVWPAQQEFEQWVEDVAQWWREQEEADFQARCQDLNRELRELAAMRV
jgi:hypothetical protein